MCDKKLQILKYETGKHHRQNLRGEIDQEMINHIEISNNPSMNYHQAFKNLYHEELQNSVLLYDNKKNLEATKRMYDIQTGMFHSGTYTAGTSPQQPRYSSVHNSSFIPPSKIKEKVRNLNYRDVEYQDYDLVKETRALDHTFKNYNGGQKFYEENDRHQMGQRVLKENMKDTLNKQISGKEEQRRLEQNRKHSETQSIQRRDFLLRQHESLVRENTKNKNMEHCSVLKEQMNEKLVERGRKSLFNYNTMSRHNPITNPIEYHIENPYILKQMQNTLKLAQK